MDESDVENTSLSHEDLLKWSKQSMADWLAKRKKPKSGTKEVLAARIMRTMHNENSSDYEYDSTDSDRSLEPETEYPAPKSLLTGWENVTDTTLSLSEKDVEIYFKHHKNPNSGKFGNFQRQLSKAKKLANEKHVGLIVYHTVSQNSNLMYLRSKCRPSMRQNVKVKGETVQQYTQYITIYRPGYIVNCDCDCKAGAAGLCAHVGASLLVLVKISTPSRTSSACDWNRPSMKSPLQPKRWEDISFLNTEHQNPSDLQPIKPYPDVYQAGPCADASAFLSDLLKGLGNVNPGCVLYSTLCSKKEDISEFLKSYEVDFCFHDKTDLLDSDVQHQISAFVTGLYASITEEMCSKLKTATTGQHNNNNWCLARAVLITSSNFGAVYKRKPATAPDSLVKLQRGYTTPPEGIKAIIYGRRNESRARRIYAEHHQRKCQACVTVQEVGLHLNPDYPYLGTSVDGEVDCPTCGKGIIEIKCPYGRKTCLWRNMSVVDCCKSGSFCCEVDSHTGDVTLKPNHGYYYQIMGQLALTGAAYCDFIVYTRKGISVQRLTLDCSLWSSMSSKLTEFYRHLVAEIMSHRICRRKKLYA